MYYGMTRERVTVKQVVKCIRSASSRLTMPDRPASILGTWKGALPIVAAIIWPLVSPTHDLSITLHQSWPSYSCSGHARGCGRSCPETVTQRHECHTASPECFLL